MERYIPEFRVCADLEMMGCGWLKKRSRSSEDYKEMPLASKDLEMVFGPWGF